jgi:5'-nucleotidase/UDP-sugar diphosphatase
MKGVSTHCPVSRSDMSRRQFLATYGAVGATMLLPRCLSKEPTVRRTFTILHTNDLHSNVIGLGPASDYTPFTLNDDRTRGGFSGYRVATSL